MQALEPLDGGHLPRQQRDDRRGKPGQKLGQGISYFFDFVFALRVEKDPDGNPYRALQTSRDFNFEAKDRSGALDPFEAPNLAAIAAKILTTN